MDRISHLPDEILGYILSFLPIRQAVSTSILSKRWRNVFLLVSSLDITYDHDRHSCLAARRPYLYDKRKQFMDFVESLFRLQGKSPIKKFTLDTHRSGLNPNRVQNWICNVLERGVIDLDLSYIKNSQFLSSLIFKNNTLVKLSLGGGFKINLSQDVYLPKLKTLCLYSVVFDGVHDVFETLLPRCPVLEELVMETWVKGSSVSSRLLKKLTSRFSICVQTISLDVPSLVYLELSCYFGVKYDSVNLDSLVEARLNLSVSGVSELRLQELRRGSAHLVPADTIDIIIQMRNVRVLHLNSGALEMFYFSGQKLPKFDNLVCLRILNEKKHGWQILPLLIKNSPNLETLIFMGLEHCKTIDCGDVCVCTGSKENTSSCLSLSRVKVLEIWFYEGTKKAVKQMKHFLENLSCLELVKIKYVNNLKVAKYIQQLLELPRASLNCKIQA